MAGEAGATGSTGESTSGESSTPVGGSMGADLIDAAEAVAKKGLEMSIAGYNAQESSKHP